MGMSVAAPGLSLWASPGCRHSRPRPAPARPGHARHATPDRPAAASSASDRSPSWARGGDDGNDGDDLPAAEAFAAGAAAFGAGEYHTAHDLLEPLWHVATAGPTRNALQGIIQVSIGLHHLTGDNHRGAMMELGEGLSKLSQLRGLDPTHPLAAFRSQTDALLDFVHATAVEFAACRDDSCAAMGGDESSYALLGDFGRGEALYATAHHGAAGGRLTFRGHRRSNGGGAGAPLDPASAELQSCAVPAMGATWDDLEAL